MQYQVRSDGTYGEYMEYPTPKDARAATVTTEGEGYRIIQTYNITVDIWMDGTSQEDTESQIKARNKRHLQQMAREEGITTGPLMSEIQANHGVNLVDDLLAGRFEMEHEVSEMTAWIEAVKQTDKEKALPRL